LEFNLLKNETYMNLDQSLLVKPSNSSVPKLMSQPGTAIPSTVNDKRILRAHIARRYISGIGVEIGALGTPLDLPPSAQAIYVDRLSLEDLRNEYPELAHRELRSPDVIDDGEMLHKFDKGSLDFIIANHVLEHCENLLGTLAAHASKLRKGGRLFYAVPNRDFTFDRHRQVTPFEHLVEDYLDGSEKHRAAHYLEWATLVEGLKGVDAQARAVQLQQAKYSIHYHAWDAKALMRTLALGTEFINFPGFVAHFELNLHEIICVLIRTD
jgi:predicted SAM-dependent methyltransferase